MVPMRVLVLGGTWFVGRAVVSAALERGWHVTTFTRSSELPDVEAVHGDRTSHRDVARLAGHGEWDVVVDTSGYVPRVVRDSAALLSGRADHYVFLSTVSVYQDWPGEGVSEDSRVWENADTGLGGVEPDDPREYGRYKRGCENAVSAAFGHDRSVILRPSVITGPWENIGRLPWWLSRFARGGRVLAPGLPNRTLQPVDARDLALFVLRCASRKLFGLFNVSAPKGHTTMGDLLLACETVTRASRPIPVTTSWIPGDWLTAHSVKQWTEMPFWREPRGTWDVDSTRAHAAGLRCRPTFETVRDAWDLLSSGQAPMPHARQGTHGLSAGREAQLLTNWDRELLG